MLYRVHLAWEGLELTTLVVIYTDCIGSYISNYHTIRSMTTPCILLMEEEHKNQERIQDFKSVEGGGRGGALKEIAPSGGRREHFWVFRVKNHDFTQKNHFFFNLRGAARRVRPPPWIRPCKLILKTNVYECVYFYFVPNCVSIDIIYYPGNIDDTDLTEQRRLIVSVNQYVKPLKRRRSKLLFYLYTIFKTSKTH